MGVFRVEAMVFYRPCHSRSLCGRPNRRGEKWRPNCNRCRKKNDRPEDLQSRIAAATEGLEAAKTEIFKGRPSEIRGPSKTSLARTPLEYFGFGGFQSFSRCCNSA